MSYKFNNFIGISKLPDETQTIIRIYALIYFLTEFFIHLSSTFLILFAIDKIGFVQAGILASIILFVQIMFDYPSGSLGDWIGQRWVLVSAYLSLTVVYLLLATAETFSSFILIGIILGFANAQASGALETWLDNNYQKSVKDSDPERKIYGFSISRISSAGIFPAVLAFILGGIFSTFISRQFVFTLQMGLSLFIIIILIKFLKDFSPKKTSFDQPITNSSDSKDKFNNYFIFLRSGVSFIFSSKSTFLMIIGFACHDLMLNIWSSLLLLPLFFAYTGTDLLTSVMRTVIWILIFPINVYIAGVSKRLSNNKLSIVIALHAIFLFMGWILVLFFVPFDNSFNLVGMVGVMLVAISINGTLLGLISILRRRILVDLVPTEIRNSVYSLIPSLVGILGIPILPIAGAITENFGLIGGILFSLVIGIFSALLVLGSIFFKKSLVYGNNIHIKNILRS